MIMYDRGREQPIRARGVDISRGGLAFQTDEYMDPLVSVWVQFSIPNPDDSWRRIESEGYVVNVIPNDEGNRFGVSFSRMPDDDRRALNDYLTLLEASGDHPADFLVTPG